MPESWAVESVAGPAAQLLALPALPGRAVRFLLPEDRAIVLGSAQPETDVDPTRAEAAGVTVLRRRSGGGAVLVGAGRVLWADVFLPPGDPLWAGDVGRAFWWLGDTWAAALGAAGRGGCRAWHGALVPSAWSRRICFAGLGSGEVAAGSAKVVGMSQRRTRAGAQFQCAVLIGWDPSELLGLMALDDEARRTGADELAAVAVGVGADVASRLGPALVAHLP